MDYRPAPEEEGPTRNAAQRSAKQSSAVAESSEARGRFEAWCTVNGVGRVVPWSIAAAPQAMDSDGVVSSEG